MHVDNHVWEKIKDDITKTITRPTQDILALRSELKAILDDMEDVPKEEPAPTIVAAPKTFTILKTNKEYYGRIGQPIGLYNVKSDCYEWCVGDVISFEYTFNDGVKKQFVKTIMSKNNETFGTRGLGFHDNLKGYENIRLIVSHKDLTQHIVDLFEHSNYKENKMYIAEQPAVALTVQEIEERLGYPVSIKPST